MTGPLSHTLGDPKDQLHTTDTTRKEEERQAEGASRLPSIVLLAKKYGCDVPSHVVTWDLRIPEYCACGKSASDSNPAAG